MPYFRAEGAFEVAAVLRAHQRDAVAAATNALRDGGRAQVVMATGTGKTLVGRAAADQLVPPGGVVAVLVPSLALVFQTVRAWAAAGPGDVLTVCSADDPGEAGASEPDSGASRALRDATGTETTTDPLRVARWLAAGPCPAGGMRLLVATYQSVRRIEDAFRSADGLRPLELVVFDEAHRAAANPQAPFATALHDDRVPALRRLFLTATPRLWVADPDNPGAVVFPGMGDEGLFGARVYELGVAEAIARGLLSDYRVVVIGVTDNQVHKLVLDNAPLLVGPRQADARTVAVQVALAQAARAYDLRRVLVFHNRVAASRDFTALLPHTLAALPDGQQPGGWLTEHHLDAASSDAVRGQVLADLSAPEAAGWTVVSNVRVLGEGVDCPALDAVVFADPREGETAVIQAVGRALRLHPERDQPAVIMIPVYLAPGENGDLVAADSDYRTVWHILRALREQDARLGAQLATARRDFAASGDPAPVLPDLVHLHFPAEVSDSFLGAFSTRLLDGTAHIHEHGMGRLLAFVDQYGHACPGQSYIDETGFRLGSWTSERRRDRARGILAPEFAEELEALPGWQWSIWQNHEDKMMAALAAYASEHGHTHVPHAHRTADGEPLGTWAHRQRRRYRQGKLRRDRIDALEAVPGWSWAGANDDRWANGLEHLRAFAGHFGHTDVKMDHTAADGFALGRWVVHQRGARSKSSPARVRALEEVPGWRWTVSEAYQDRMMIAVARYHAARGPVPMPETYVSDDDPGLTAGVWMDRMRASYTTGRMPADLAARFEAIPDFVWNRTEAVTRKFLKDLADYTAEHGAAAPPGNFVTADGTALGLQALRYRARYRAGLLPEELAEDLQAMPGWSWGRERTAMAGPRQERFDRSVRALAEYASAHGTCVLPPGLRGPDGRDITRWAARLRADYRRGRLTGEQIAKLEAVPGWFWDSYDHAWNQAADRLRAYAADYGTAAVPVNYVTADGFHLGMWVTRQRDAFTGRGKRAPMTAERAALLESLPGWRWTHPRDRSRPL